jgi:mannose-6-phosphate isomerase-like protein (cupin superfamily)
MNDHDALAVSRATAVQHYEWGEGCHGWRLLDSPDLSVIEERVPPGGAEIWHVHDRARQFFYLLSGSAEMRSRAGAVVLQPGTGVEVPIGVAHQFANTGDVDARFLVISAPSTLGDRRDA